MLGLIKTRNPLEEIPTLPEEPKVLPAKESETKLDDVVLVIDGAIRLLKEGGWVQGFPELHGHYCISGALTASAMNQVYFDTTWSGPHYRQFGTRALKAYNAAYRLIEDAVGKDPVHFNDELPPAKGKKIVIQALEQAKQFRLAEITAE